MAQRADIAASSAHWEQHACGIHLPLGEPGSKTFFENLRRFKYEVDYPEILKFVRFDEWAGREVLEIGCGLGSDTQTWLEAGVPVDEHLADQLLLPAALAGGGVFRTTKPSLHATTNAAVIQRFLSVALGFEQENALVWSVNVGTG